MCSNGSRWLPHSELLVGSGILAFNNPRVPWSEVERIASGRPPVPGDGNDAPAWSRKREGYAGAPEDLRVRRRRDDAGDRIRAPFVVLFVLFFFCFLVGVCLFVLLVVV